MVKSELGDIFGRFISKAWTSNGEWITDPEASSSSFINKENKPFKVPVYDIMVLMPYFVVANDDRTFGGGWDNEINQILIITEIPILDLVRHMGIQINHIKQMRCDHFSRIKQSHNTIKSLLFQKIG